MNENEFQVHIENSNHGFSIVDENDEFAINDLHPLDEEWMKYGPLGSDDE